MNRRLLLSFPAVALLTMLLTAAVYWPVVHANFVWDDWPDFHDQTWLRLGDEWKHYIFKDFNEWSRYFRPFVVGLFTLQVRAFNSTPGPMHAVSLILHLVNTLLVGLLAKRLLENSDGAKRISFVAASMLIYGLHPVLIEPVAWIACQFELVVTLLTLLALLADIAIQNALLRALTVALLFFLAACSKESAISLPLLLIIFEWLTLSRQPDRSVRHAISRIARQNFLTYAAVFLAGIAYLALRHWAIGHIINPFAGSSLSSFGHLQEICFLYIHYWKTLLWPMAGMSPIHPVNVIQFNSTSSLLVFTDVASVTLFCSAVYAAFRRPSTIGCLVLAVSASLLPVLHIAAAEFDKSLYHERYVMTALAAACVMLPLLSSQFLLSKKTRHLSFPIFASVTLVWIIFSIINVRVTIPLWANNVNLWRWALATNPGSVEAQDHLLATYIAEKYYLSANQLIDKIAIDNVDCPNCFLNAAILYLKEDNASSAAIALNKVKNFKGLLADKQMFFTYLVVTGQMLALQNNLKDAEDIFRYAIQINPVDPVPKISLGLALAKQGSSVEARKIGETGISKLPWDEKNQVQLLLDNTIISGKKLKFDEKIESKDRLQ